MNTTQTTENVDCTCTGDQTVSHTPHRRETNLFVVTTWVCDRCDGTVYQDWALKAS